MIEAESDRIPGDVGQQAAGKNDAAGHRAFRRLVVPGLQDERFHLFAELGAHTCRAEAKRRANPAPESGAHVFRREG